MKTTLVQAGLAVSFGAYAASAQSCASVLLPKYKPPMVAPGYQAQLVATGMKKPRSMEFDSAGGLLVVDAGVGVTRITFKDNGGTCLQVEKTSAVVNDPALNHGLALSADGKTLYASSVAQVFSWAYDAQSGTVSGLPKIVVNGMQNNDQTTRTLLMSKTKPGTLVVSRGSSENFDEDALNVDSGLSQIKAFDLTNLTATSPPYSFNTAGRRLGWGLRNSVGVAEHPLTGKIYSVENSIDGLTRNGVDIRQNNPGEELNYHGPISNTTQGGNYGYPSCVAVWDPSIPDSNGLKVGSQFSVSRNGTAQTDATCFYNYIAPRLTFPAHYAPLDIKFSKDGATAYVAFHGSFDKKDPVGYRLSALAFDPTTGEPVAQPDSTTALSDIITIPDYTGCPTGCFRPCGMTWDAVGRLWLTSDTTGEIYVIQKSTTPPTSTTSGTIVTATSKPNGASGSKVAMGGVLAAVAVFAGMMVL